MSSHTSLSDHCNSVPRSASVIYSEPLLNILVAWSRSKFLSTSIQTSYCCRSCSRSNTRKQTSSGNVGPCQILTAVKRNN